LRSESPKMRSKTPESDLDFLGLIKTAPARGSVTVNLSQIIPAKKKPIWPPKLGSVRAINAPRSASISSAGGRGSPKRERAYFTPACLSARRLRAEVIILQEEQVHPRSFQRLRDVKFVGADVDECVVCPWRLFQERRRFPPGGYRARARRKASSLASMGLFTNKNTRSRFRELACQRQPLAYG